MSRSLYSGVNKVHFRSYLLLNIVAPSACMLLLMHLTIFSIITITWLAIEGLAKSRKLARNLFFIFLVSCLEF